MIFSPAWSRGLSLARKSALAVASALERMGADTGVDAADGLREREIQRRQLIISIDPNRVGHTIDPRVQFGIDYD